MPYTRSWDETAPSDASASNLLGQDIRQLKVDIRERMDSILLAGADWESGDPIQLDPAKISALTGLEYYIPFSKFIATFNVSSVVGLYVDGEGGPSESYVNLPSGKQTYFIPLDGPFRTGVIIQQVSLVAQIGIGGTAVLNLRHLDPATANGIWAGPDVTLNAPFNADGNYHRYDTAAGLAVTLAAAFYQFFLTTPNNNDKYEGIIIKYDMP